MLLDRVDETVGRSIHAEVNHFETRAAQHHDAEIFADVVQIALHRPHDHLRDRLDP